MLIHELPVVTRPQVLDVQKTPLTIWWSGDNHFLVFGHARNMVSGSLLLHLY